MNSDCELGLSCGGAGVCENVPPPEPRTTPTAVEFSFVSGGPDPAPQRIDLYNAGGGSFEFHFTGATWWLDAEPDEGVISAGGQSVVVTLSFKEATDWPPGTYEDSLTIYGGGARSLEVPVTFRVAPP
jgi:hypothetical protein